jgi:hypothetical protein
MAQPLTQEEIIEWRSALSEMSSDQLLTEWKMARKLCSTAPKGESVEITVDGKTEAYTTAEYASGTFFQLSQLIRSEMNRRGIPLPGAQR